MTSRGAPIAHMVVGRTTEQDLTDLLEFVLSVRPGWRPALVVIDKDLTEFNGIQTFLTRHSNGGKVFICFFHVKQAILRWMTASKNMVGEDIRDQVMTAISQMHYAKSEVEFTTKQTVFLAWLDKVHAKLAAYMRANWFSAKFCTLWSRCFVPMTGDLVVFTNNYLESWHKLFKYKGLGGKNNRRLDDLFDVLNDRMHELLWRALYFPDDAKRRAWLTKSLGRVRDRGRGALVSGGDREQGVWQVLVGGELCDVNLRGFLSDGPHCSCVAAESLLCEHILTAVLWGMYTKDELLAFGFNGNADSQLQSVLLGTFRGLSPLGPSANEPEQQDVSDEKCSSSPSLAEEDIRRYAEVQLGLEAAFTPWRAMTAHGRLNLHNSLWLYFKRLLSQDQRVQRTRLGHMPSGHSGPRLPRTRLPRRKRAPASQAARRVSPLVLNAYFLDQIANGRPAEAGPGGELAARRILATAPGGDIKKLHKSELKSACKGLGLNVGGTKDELVARIKAHDTRGPVRLT